MKVLLSIKPKYVERILSGDKKYEFRKKIFKEEVESIVIYSSSPVKKVIGEITIDKVIKNSPKKLWEETKLFAGIEQEDFHNYYKEKDIGFAIKIKKVKKYDNPITLDQFFGKKSTPPQSFMYCL